MLLPGHYCISGPGKNSKICKCEACLDLGINSYLFLVKGWFSLEIAFVNVVVPPKDPNKNLCDITKTVKNTCATTDFSRWVPYRDKGAIYLWFE